MYGVYTMHRTQILLDEWQYERLKAAAQGEGRSLSDVVREAVDGYFAGPRTGLSPGLERIAGIGADPEASGRDHDLLLYGGENRDRASRES